MEINCFALKENSECRILNNTRKCGEHCTFRKTTAEADANTERANARLRSLPLHQQASISGTYYVGKMPWAEVKA